MRQLCTLKFLLHLQTAIYGMEYLSCTIAVQNCADKKKLNAGKFTRNIY